MRVQWRTAGVAVWAVLGLGWGTSARAEETAGGAGAEPEPAPAAEDDGAGGEPVLETVVVGRREPQDPFAADRSVSVVDAEALAERAPRTTPEALWDAAGVFVQQTSHGGGSPILRGLVGPQNLVLVEGIRLNNSVYRTGPVQYLNLVDPLSLERIEVLRGPGSVLYGSDAMGGVVSLQTLGSGEGPGRALRLEGEATGRYGTADGQRTGHARVRVEGEGLAVRLAGTLQAFEDLDGGGTVGVQRFSGYDRQAALVRADLRLEDGPLAGARVTLGYLLGAIDRAGRTDKLLDARSLQFYDNLDQLAWTRLRLPVAALQTELELLVSYQGFFERKDTVTVGSDLATEERTVRDETGVDTLGIDLRSETRWLEGRLRLGLGGGWYRDWVGAAQWRRERGGSFGARPVPALPDGSEYDIYGAFALLEGEPWRGEGGHALRLAAGYRLHGMAGRAPAHGMLPGVDEAYLGHVVLGSVGYLWEERLTVAATFSQGFRAPNLSEAVLLGDTGRFFHVPNPDLGPERSDTVELLARGRFFGVTLGASGYVSLLHDLIRRETTTWEGEETVGGKPVAWDANGGEALLWGVEAELAVELGSGFSLSGHLGWAWGEEQLASGEAVPLTRIPPLFGQAAVRWDGRLGPGWDFFAELYLRAADAQDRLSPEDETDARIPEGGTPGWWTLNLRAGLDVAHRLRFALDLQNLADEAYKYHGSGVYAPGTSAVLSLSAAF